MSRCIQQHQYDDNANYFTSLAFSMYYLSVKCMHFITCFITTQPLI